jgi:hypothetical protein
VPWNKVFAGYAAAVDNPASCVWRELLEANPAAKVILTLHPRGADAWYRARWKPSISPSGCGSSSCSPP